MKPTLRRLALPACLMLLQAASFAQSKDVERFEARVFKNAKGETMPYRLFIPQPYDEHTKYPLVLWLHGIDAVGNDNTKQISDNNFTGPNVWTRPDHQAKRPCFVLAPQCPFGAVWATPLTRSPTKTLLLAVEVLEDVQKQYSIDADRLYVVGQSLGGFGTWALVTRHPDMFAAAVPVCGGGNAAKARALAKLPVWAFHSIDDPIVLVFESRAMISAIKEAGGSPKYTEYKAGQHNAWDRAFNDPEMIAWLFAQKRASR